MCPWRAHHTRGKRWRRANTRIFTSPSIPPLDSARHASRNDAWVLLFCRRTKCRRTFPAAARPGRGQIEQSRPGTGRPFHALILLFADFLSRPLASQRGLHALFFTGFQVIGVSFDFLDNVFLLRLALETPQGILEGFSLLQPDFGQADTPPDQSGRTEYLLQSF